MRFPLRLFGIPAVFLLVAYLLLDAGQGMAATSAFAEYGPYLRYGAGGSILFAALMFLYNAWRVWQAFKGVGEVCHSCGMPVSRKSGPDGPYFQCWNCDTRRSAR